MILDQSRRYGVALLTNMDWTDAARPLRMSMVMDLLKGASLLA